MKTTTNVMTLESILNEKLKEYIKGYPFSPESIKLLETYVLYLVEKYNEYAVSIEVFLEYKLKDSLFEYGNFYMLSTFDFGILQKFSFYLSIKCMNYSVKIDDNNNMEGDSLD